MPENRRSSSVFVKECKVGSSIEDPGSSIGRTDRESRIENRVGGLKPPIEGAGVARHLDVALAIQRARGLDRTLPVDNTGGGRSVKFGDLQQGSHLEIDVVLWDLEPPMCRITGAGRGAGPPPEDLNGGGVPGQGRNGAINFDAGDRARPGRAARRLATCRDDGRAPAEGQCFPRPSGAVRGEMPERPCRCGAASG